MTAVGRVARRWQVFFLLIAKVLLDRILKLIDLHSTGAAMKVIDDSQWPVSGGMLRRTDFVNAPRVKEPGTRMTFEVLSGTSLRHKTSGA